MLEAIGAVDDFGACAGAGGGGTDEAAFVLVADLDGDAGNESFLGARDPVEVGMAEEIVVGASASREGLSSGLIQSWPSPALAMASV